VKVKELRNLIGKRVKFSSSNTRRFLDVIRYGVVEDVERTETLIGGDWHQNRSIKIYEVFETRNGG